MAGALSPRLVPEPLWRISGTRLLIRSQWKKIRQDALEACAGACSICGAVRERMVCDEDWTYKDNVATLEGVQIICPDCNGVIHIGRTMSAGYGDVALEHLMRVNAIDVKEARLLISSALATWREQSMLNWTVAVSPHLLERYPALATLSGRIGQPGEGTARLDPANA
jgi:hypothetical protein